MTGCKNIDGLAGRVHIFSQNLNFQYTMKEFFHYLLLNLLHPHHIKGTIILVAIMNISYSGFSHAKAPYVQ